jgi:hypothetical protein
MFLFNVMTHNNDNKIFRSDSGTGTVYFGISLHFLKNEKRRRSLEKSSVVDP